MNATIILKNPTGTPGMPSNIAKDANIGWAEKGLVYYIASLPDGKEISISDLVAKSSIDNEETIRNYLSNLKTAGYLALEKKDENVFWLRVNDSMIRGNDDMVGFDQFWAEYPRKTAKVLAVRSWKRAACSRCIPQLMAALKKFKASPNWIKDGGMFIPHPASWINQRRWEDEIVVPRIRRGPNI